MGLINNVFGRAPELKQEQTVLFAKVPNTDSQTDGIFKAFIPGFLYKPPYGYPRMVNVPFLKQLSKNAYVFSVIKTLCDEAVSVGWEIKVKNEFQEDGNDYAEDINKITAFLRNPNGNEDSFEHILRQVITGILEVDAGVIVKVFNEAGEMTQIFARAGGNFLKNPDIYGYLGNRAQYVPPMEPGFDGNVPINAAGTPSEQQQQMIKRYDLTFREAAAYFQYGVTGGSLPIPFGRREIIYLMQNPRPDSIYGRSPIEVLGEIIMNLVYGSEFNLDFYTNNNMPEGVVQLLGANKDQMEQFRDNWENQFKFTDELGKRRKKFFQFPLSSMEVKFTPFALTSKDLDVLAQQEWFTKILWMCFGVTANEMGFTETVNKAVGEEQVKLSKRKALTPLLGVIEYHLNSQLIPEFYTTGEDLADQSNVPVEFRFTHFDHDESMQKHSLLQMELNMGVITPEMAAKELGINVEELIAEKERAKEEQMETLRQQQGISSPAQEPEEEEEPEEKAVADNKEELQRDIKKEIKDPLKDMDNYIDAVAEELIQLVDKIPENDIKR